MKSAELVLQECEIRRKLSPRRRALATREGGPEPPTFSPRETDTLMTALMLLRWAKDRVKARFGRSPAAEQKGFADWPSILATRPELWAEARRKALRGPKVLIATNIGGMPNVTVPETALAVALTLRGAQVHILLCDGVLPGCLRAELRQQQDPTIITDYRLGDVSCAGCIAKGNAAYQALGLTTHFIGKGLAEGEREEARRLANSIPLKEIPAFRLRDMAVGEHAYAGALRYFARGDLEGEPHGEGVLRRYLEAALVTAFSLDRLLVQEGYAASLFHHGIYVPQGIVGEACRKHGVRVANWQAAYRQNTFIFSHGDTYHHTLMDEPVDVWEGMQWGPTQEKQIVDYLRSRWSGTRDWIWFHNRPDEDYDAFAKKFGLDPAKPVIGMLTNVMWDAQLHYRANAFENMLTWVVDTIAYFATRPDLQLLMRVHPAEIRGTVPSRQPLMTEIAKAFPKLPRNVFIIPPESEMSTYVAMERCDSVIIYGTKTGVELTSVGIPVVVAGEAWIRNKGLTLDAGSKEEYRRLLDRLPLKAPRDEKLAARARKYAYHFFFRRMIPLPFIVPNTGGSLYRVSLDSLDGLLPGRFPGLDVICDGVLERKPFVYSAETRGLHDS